MKIVFLDVDGVLNTVPQSGLNQRAEASALRIDEDKVQLLSTIIRETGARIVLHSGWRLWLDDGLRPVRPEAEALVRMLGVYRLELWDKTPDLSTAEIRENKRFSQVKAREIRAWLAMHPEVSRYLVLEDRDLNDASLAAVQIKPDSAVGLTRRGAEAAIRILNG